MPKQDKKLGKPDVVRKYRSLTPLFKDMSVCTRCELALTRTHVVPGVGNRNAEIMLLGEAPGKNEDLAATPFVGRGGQLLDEILTKAGISRDDVFITNTAACRPPKNRTPRTSEVRAHAPWLEQQIQLVDPVVVVTLGRVALTYFLPKAKVTELRGKPQKVQYGDHELTVFPTLHPAAALRDPKLKPAIASDFRKLAAWLNKSKRRKG